MTDELLGTGIDDFETSIADMTGEQVDEFSEQMDYDKFVVLDKKELTLFCRMIEPLSKVAIDEYGKSVHIESVNEDSVVLKYVGKPYVVSQVIANKSGKTIDEFSVSLTILKKLVTNAYASLIFVEQEKNGVKEYSISVCNSLLYVETKPLDCKTYKFEQAATVPTIDKQKALYTFKTIGSILSCADRAAEKVVIIKNNKAYFNTGAFVARTDSPFGETKDFVLWKAVTDLIAVLAETTKNSLNYYLDDTNPGKEKLVLLADGVIYCECPFGPEQRVSEFYNPGIEQLLNFEASVSIMGDSLLKLVALVKNLDYLSNIVSIEFTDDKVRFVIYSQDMQKSSPYEFPIVEGHPDNKGVLKSQVEVLKTFLELTGTDVKYAFNDNGLGIHNDNGSFLMRKTS